MTMMGHNFHAKFVYTMANVTGKFLHTDEHCEYFKVQGTVVSLKWLKFVY